MKAKTLVDFEKNTGLRKIAFTILAQFDRLSFLSRVKNGTFRSFKFGNIPRTESNSVDYRQSGDVARSPSGGTRWVHSIYLCVHGL